MTLLSDAADRELAATSFERNVVVTAGAGTGKTTLLVDRLAHLLMREPEPLKITEIVALTFTNKAANEIKLRLRERLQAYLDARIDREPTHGDEEKLHEELKSLIHRYHLSKAKIDERSRLALQQMERSEIGTIHSFAATLLRLHPMESGLDPQFREDDGSGFERYFEEGWAVWLDQELSARGPRKEEWKQVLRKVSLEEIRSLAFSLCSETVDLDRLQDLSRDGEVAASLRAWLKQLEEKATELIRSHPEEKHQIDRLTRAALKMIREFLRHGRLSEGALEEERALVTEKEPGRVKGWGEEEFEQARELVRVARRLRQVEGALMRLFSDLLIPLAGRCREGFVKEGFVSFDGLLVRARNLVRDHPTVRADLKRHFRAILIDEFQDTDPIQYEILLYLAEQTGRQAKDWRKVRLTPGKIFVVGDPKQSIYGFRRADIEAYLEVIENRIEAQNGVECRLTTNFRSHAGILDAINGVFEPLIRPRAGLQPSYVAIHPTEPNDQHGGVESRPSPFRKVVIRKVETEGETSADLARRLEAESLARWLQEEVLGKAGVLDRDHRPQVVRPGDVAILLRTLTHVHQYLEPLRRRGIRYVVEGERHFYAAQEIIDAVNLLRAVENPYDRSALVGLLRSPVGGLTDRQIYQLHLEELLDYRTAKRQKKKAEKLLSLVGELYDVLDRLHWEARKLPVGEAVSRIFDSLPIRLLAAHSFSGEQAVANLEKLRQQAGMIGREGAATLKEVITMLQRRVGEVKEEGESALAEEDIDAVRILSVHKAKGLEFPVVILAGCHAPVDLRKTDPQVEHDWSKGLVGLKAGDYWNLPGIFLAEKRRSREEEEEKRVLYVAMTRAREHLTLSCAPSGRQRSGSFLALLENSIRGLSALTESTLIPVGKGILELEIVRETLGPPRASQREIPQDSPPTDWASYAQLWQQRSEDYQAALKKPLFLTPTLLQRREAELAEGSRQGRRRGAATPALLVGELSHRFLQEWDFALAPETFRERLGPFLERWVGPESPAHREGIGQELEEIFARFFSSPAYAELGSSRILGREVPFFIPWDGQIMEGVIDLVYEREGLLYLADYKTDRVEKRDLSQAAAGYHHQVRIYSEAARRSLHRDVAGFKLIFLRLGEALEAAGNP